MQVLFCILYIVIRFSKSLYPFNDRKTKPEKRKISERPFLFAEECDRIGWKSEGNREIVYELESKNKRVKESSPHSSTGRKQRKPANTGAD